MEFCSCETKVWANTRLVDRVLTHGACSMTLACSKCGKETAINLGADGPECEDCSPLFSDEFFSDSFDLEKGMLDGFIYHAGGIKVKDLLTETPDFNNADYYFKADDVLVELKILQTEFAQTPEHLEKFEKMMLDWLNDGRLTEAQCTGQAPPPGDFIRAHMQMLREPIQRITNKANKQIKQTKEKLGLTTAKGIVLYLIDGFYQADPNLTITLIGDPLTRHMTSVDGYVVFSLRKKISIPDDSFDRFFWDPKYRNGDNVKLSEFVNRLGAAWFSYLQELSGNEFADTIENEDPDSTLLSRAKFKTVNS
jgi:hypothetical protein